MSSADKGGGDLFIVDNSVSGWTGLRYLQEWTEIADRFDIATGYFEVGSLLELDGSWQKLDKIRILMGDECTYRTKKALVEAVTKRTQEYLNAGLEADKDPNPFLDGVPAIVEAIRTGQIECRVYSKNKFHAKAYITHAKLEVIGARALVGSSNFTRPGLTQNIELNVQIQSGQEVAQLQHWFEQHWDMSEDISGDIITVLDRHIREYTPFEVYAKALYEFFKGHEMTASEWEQGQSQMFSKLDLYQREAYWALLKIARQHGGAFLCDGVGLGKTFVGLMLIERLILHENKRVVLFAPKAAKEAVWEPHLRTWLPHIGGVGGGADFSNLAVFSHTDLNREGEFPDRFKRITELADVVIIDEAHHFRNPGKRGELTEDEDSRSRYYRLYDLLDGSTRQKSLYMLTATPINNQLSDFRHMIELFSRCDESYFAQTLGIANLRAYFNNLEKSLRQRLGESGGDLTDSTLAATDFLSGDNTFQSLVVQRSRAYAKESQIRETGNSAAFPERKAPKVAEYSIRQTYGRLLELMDKAFEKDDPLFSLPIYYPLAYYTGDDKNIDAFEENRQRQVVGLIRTQFLKRFESSIASFELSCERLMKKLIAFIEVHNESDGEAQLLDRWKRQNADVLDYSVQRKLDLWGEGTSPEEDDDVVSDEERAAVVQLDRSEYRVADMIAETYLDLNEIVRFLSETRRFDPQHDDKLKKLVRLLKTKELDGEKVLIFTEFADTARYLHRRLKEDGIEGVAQIDSGTKGKRSDLIKRFSPYYNDSTSSELVALGLKEIRVLISTDVLSEGLNLQDATKLVNYDIHWNPVRLMQRIGRVDRRMNPATEAKMVADHPKLESSRGKVTFWNFLPPDELNAVLTLYTKVSHKTLVISKTLGIEGGKLLRPDDNFDPLREFNQAYEGSKTVIEGMHLEYQALVQEHPELALALNGYPLSVFSGRKRPSKKSRGIFFCYGLPALDKEKGEFTEEAGTTKWYLYDLDQESILEEPSEIVDFVRSEPKTARVLTTSQERLVDVRAKVLKHIKNTYLKRLDVPLDAPKPALRCWMELNEG